MVVVGADVHKSTHTFVAVDEVGRKLGQLTVKATSEGHLAALAWARREFGEKLTWAIGRAYYEKKKAEGMSNREALRCLKRRLARTVFNHLSTDTNPRTTAKPACTPAAA